MRNKWQVWSNQHSMDWTLDTGANGANGEPNWIVRPPSLPVSCMYNIPWCILAELVGILVCFLVCVSTYYSLVHVGSSCQHMQTASLPLLDEQWPDGRGVWGVGWRPLPNYLLDPSQFVIFLYNLQTRRYNHLSNVISVQNFRELAHTILNREGFLQLLRNEWDGFF